MGSDCCEDLRDTLEVNIHARTLNYCTTVDRLENHPSILHLPLFLSSIISNKIMPFNLVSYQLIAPE